MDESSGKRHLFRKFINNQCTEDELRQVWQYIDADNIPEEFEEVMRQQLDEKLLTQPQLNPALSAEMYARITERIPVSGPVRKLPFHRSYAIAAAASLLLLSAFLLYYFVVSPAGKLEYVNGYGKTQQITLPDGTLVALNGNSRLTFEEGWQAKLQQDTGFVREVWLQGEAFFEVKKMQRPTRFVVHTEALEVEVLGTKFNVNSREQKTRVVLNEGKVKVHVDDQPELVMQPGELVEIAHEEAKLEKKQVNTANYSAWRHDELTFEAMPLSEIATMLRDSYGYQVNISAAISEQQMLFTGKAPADNPELLLRMLEESFAIKITQKNKTLNFNQ